MLQKIICYGDSNTYGYDASDVFGGPLPQEQRWPFLLGKALACETVNCGMNGRTVPRYPRSTEADMRLLGRYSDCDLIIVMLGTNDLLLGFGVENTVDAMREYLSMLQRTMPGCAILLTAPPPAEACPDGCDADFEELAAEYSRLAAELGLHFADASRWDIETACDGVHFSTQGHRCFADRMAETIRRINL